MLFLPRFLAMAYPFTRISQGLYLSPESDFPSMPQVVLEATASNSGWLDWKAYRVEGWGDEGVFYFEGSPDAPGFCHPEVHPFMEGYVKWDGCIEYTSDQIHFCEKHQLDIPSGTLKLVYHAAAEMLPDWDTA
ncbi:MAG: hypothetical protein GY930_02840 [bacterium]|nr:hypothetical protein [bacterium]